MTRLLIVLVCVLAPAVAVADDTALAEKAKVYYQQGQSLYAQGRYREARAEFSAGYDLSKKPGFLFNMAECSRLLGERAAALQTYQRYLVEDPSGKLVALAKQRIAELQASSPAPTGVPPPPPIADPAATVGTRDAPSTPKAAPSPVPNPPPARRTVADPSWERPASSPVIPSPKVAAEQLTPPGRTGTDEPMDTTPVSRPIWKKWPFWAVVGGVVVGTSAVLYVTMRPGSGGSDIVWE